MDERTTIDVILVEPGEEAKMITMGDNLEAMQGIVGGLIEEYMPYEDEVALVCNDEGKMIGMPPNRAIKDADGTVMDIIAGPFFVAYAPIESERFLSMPDELQEKYLEKFRLPEKFFRTDGGIVAVPYTPVKDDFER